MSASHPTPLPREPLVLVAYLALLALVATVQFSLFAAQSLALPVLLLAWGIMLWTGRSRFEVPAFAVPLAVYGLLTLVSALFSRDPRESLIDCKQLVLYFIVPAVYAVAVDHRARRVLNVAITMGAVSAIVGVIQYGVFAFDTLGKRPLGFLGHWMTYSGLLMLVITATAARLLYERRNRVWPALVLPALVAAVALTLTRSAWVGTCAGVGTLLLMKDFRLVAVLPLVAALAVVVAPASVTGRLYSMFNLQDDTNRDRVAMLKAGAAIVRHHPLLGVGPNMIEVVYPVYRTPDAVKPTQPHLHNVPMQIAAERGLPALAVWGWFVVTLSIHLYRKLRTAKRPFAAAAALGAVVAMVAAGLFENNFGDSEFLMLFLVMITLPFADDREQAPVAAAAPASS